VVKTDSPYKTIEDVIAAAKAKPGHLSVGNSGVATLAHSIALIIEKSADDKFKHVPYQGGAP
jgi:tripartite-type tricarboxylate transporter receptor subunit TctC